MASLRTLVNEILNNIILNEIGEASIEPIKYNKINNFKYSFGFPFNNENINVKVEFELIEDTISKHYYFHKVPNYKNKEFYNVAFTINGEEYQAIKSDLKTILKIMSTLSYIVKEFISNNNPDGLYIEANNKDLNLLTGKQQKSYLYQAYLDKQIKTLTNYNLYTIRDGFNVIKK